MKYGSVCSGIEAATAAWHPLGWKPSFFSEIEAFPRAVLEHRYPETRLHGDFTTIKDGDYDPIELLVGGTPCQSFSVAGLRKGLDDPRGNLMLGFGALAKRLRPSWLVWENVPGVLSANGGRDFGTFLGMLGELGYGFAYRVLDAQYFGVAQRRRRVFVVGYLGDWRPPAAVLFERHSLSGHPAPSREAREETAGNASGSASGGKQWPARIASTLDTTMQKYRGLDNQHVNAGCPLFVPQVIHATQDPCVSDRAHTLGRNSGQENAVFCFAQNSRNEIRLEGGDGSRTGALSTGGGKPGQGMPAVCYSVQAGALRQNPSSGPDGVGVQSNLAYTLEARAEVQATAFQMAVRRLTPVECERLQGFEDNYTLIPTAAARKIERDYYEYLRSHRPDLTLEQARRLSKDGPRYKALGNSMAVPVMRWIGERIQTVEGILAEQKEAAA